MPRGRRVASRGVGERPLGRVRRAAGAGVGGDGRGEQQRARVHVGVGAAAARVGARARRRAVERAASGRDARARARAGLAAVARGVPLRRRRGGGGARVVGVGVGWSVSVARRRRVARRVRVGAVGVDGVGGRARGRLVRRRGVERRRVLLPPARARARRGAAARAVARRHARGGGGRRLPRRVHAALPSRECVARGARAVRRRVAARVRVAGALGRREGGGRVDERAAVRAGGVVGCGGVVHVPAVGGGELGRAGARARGGRRAADGARARLLPPLVVVGLPDVPFSPDRSSCRFCRCPRGFVSPWLYCSRAPLAVGEQQRARLHAFFLGRIRRVRPCPCRALDRPAPWRHGRHLGVVYAVSSTSSLPILTRCEYSSHVSRTASLGLRFAQLFVTRLGPPGCSRRLGLLTRHIHLLLSTTSCPLRIHSCRRPPAWRHRGAGDGRRLSCSGYCALMSIRQPRAYCRREVHL